jgi:hypothetical protein
MATIRKRKDLMWTEVAKNDQDSLLDNWLWDQIRPVTWDKIAQVFPQEGKCSPHQKWVLITEDTKSLVPIRYQQYVITVKLNPDKQCGGNDIPVAQRTVAHLRTWSSLLF